MEIKTTIQITQAPDLYGNWGPRMELIHVIEEPFNTVVSGIIQKTKEYAPNKGDKLFFLPGCTVPRFKMKKFCEEYGTAMVKYKEKASALFVGTESIKELMKQTYSYTMSVDSFRDFMRKHGKPELLSMIEQINAKYIYVIYNNVDVIKKFTTTGFKPVDDLKYRGGKACQFKDEESLNIFKSFIDTPNIYHEKDVLRRINTGKPLMEEDYTSLLRFFESSDDNNIKLAMDIMANCDYEKSSVYLMLLFYKYGFVMRDMNTVKHVNFKSLLKFFNLSNLDSVYLDTMVDSLIALQLLNRQNIEVLLPEVTARFNEVNTKAHIRHFRCSAIEYSDEIAEALNNNILDATHDTTILSEPEESLNPHV